MDEKNPVIFLSFKDVKFDSWEAYLDKIAELVQGVIKLGVAFSGKKAELAV